MSLSQLLPAMNISASGLSAERFRMEVVANNLANAFSTRTPQGGPYRRQDVVFASVLDERLTPGRNRPELRLGGVQVQGVVQDPSPLIPVFRPGHPDADADGFVLFPNVQLPLEMVDLITANRAFEANLRVLQAFRDQIEQALALLRS
ncbi:MAG: flagellar basal-body rod protein FlgC [Gemmatales bacterium]|nr:MAG: flagellar basal-body rod protein FlgC [Gemmatales bacterium]